jgi:hypothetical protein
MEKPKVPLTLNPFKLVQTAAEHNQWLKEQEKENQLFEIQKEKLKIENERLKLENEQMRASAEHLRQSEGLGGVEKMYDRVQAPQPQIEPQKKGFFQKLSELFD